jgi:DNA processing protein
VSGPGPSAPANGTASAAAPAGAAGAAGTVTEEERLARVALGRLGEPGDPRLSALVAELGAVRVHRHLADERDLGGMLTDVASRLAALDPARDLERADRAGIRFLVPGDAEWPGRLGDLDHCGQVQDRGGSPLGLWVRGPFRLDRLTSAVAVVGSRSATTYGADVAGEIGAHLGEAGVAVVSGAAFGIDQAAHRGALAGGGPTVAVLACGVDRTYPAAHKALLDHLAGHGAVVSELAPGCAPSRLRFLSRNRMIAALSLGTVVVEAAVRSGALNTAHWTDRLSRPLMGVPGPVTSAQSQGVHQLLRTGGATLVTRGADVAELVGVAGEHLVVDDRGPERARDRLRGREAQVLDAVPVTRAAAADSISRTAGIGLVEVQRLLARLHGLGLVQRTGSGWRLAPAAR